MPCITFLPYAILFPSYLDHSKDITKSSSGWRKWQSCLDIKDIDSRMRMVFYPAIIGWTLLGVWITTLKIRLSLLKEKDCCNEKNNNLVRLIISLIVNTM